MTLYLKLKRFLSRRFRRSGLTEVCFRKLLRSTCSRLAQCVYARRARAWSGGRVRLWPREGRGKGRGGEGKTEWKGGEERGGGKVGEGRELRGKACSC